MLISESNFIMMTDSYKQGHAVQYPPGTTKVYSYAESRGSKRGWTHMVVHGIQPIIENLADVVIRHWMIEEATQKLTKHFGNDFVFKPELWEHIIKKHNGRLPLLIRALPEGSVIPLGTPFMTIENTCDNCFWLTNFVESILQQVWYPTTVATQSFYLRLLLTEFAQLSSEDEDVSYKLVDFGVRGSTSMESAAIGGAAHLLSFNTTDNLPAIEYIEAFYSGDWSEGVSIPASEHSTITSWGKEHEVDAFRNMLEKYPTGMVACVSDSWDIYNAGANLWGKELKDMVLGRDGVLVIRPDSGNPEEVLPKLMDQLGAAFGWTLNKKGFKVLPPQVRIIQGDGISYDTLEGLLTTLIVVHKWSLDNFTFGSGGGLLQMVNRDTLKMAIKCSYMEIDDVGRDVYKDPVTDPGKVSKTGRFSVYLNKTTGDWRVMDYTMARKIDPSAADYDYLLPMFEDGELLRRPMMFSEISEQVRSQIPYVMSKEVW